MSMGRADVKYIGGFRDGDEDLGVSAMSLSDELAFATGMWFRKKDDSMVIMKGPLDDSWDSFGTHKYKKIGKNKDTGFIEYSFESEEMIHRCSANTKSGSRCKKNACKDFEYCTVHK